MESIVVLAFARRVMSPQTAHIATSIYRFACSCGCRYVHMQLGAGHNELSIKNNVQLAVCNTIVIIYVPIAMVFMIIVVVTMLVYA